jgi:type I restriction enzyme M protein
VEIGDAVRMLLVLLALMSKSTPAEWQQIRDAAPAELDTAVRSAIQSHFPFADELLSGAELPTRFIDTALRTLSTYDRDRLSLMADALLEWSANSIGYKSGEFTTPESVRKLIIGLAEPVGSVYDPAAGTGQLIVDAANYIDAAVEHSDAAHFIGQEVHSGVWAMAQLNLAVHGVHADIAQGDVFSDDRFPHLRSDRVLAVPPWNQRLAIDERSKNDPRWIFGEPGPNDGNAAWIQHCLYHLADEGRAVLVLPTGALFEVGRAGRIRQRIIKAGLLDAVIALPPALFSWTSIPSTVLVFSKRSAGGSAQPASLMVDLSDSGDRPSRQTATLANDLVEEVAETYRRWTEGKPPDMENAAVADFVDIAANDFVIIPARYLPVIHTAPDIEEAKQRKRELLHHLETLSAACREADEQLRKLLGATR